MTVLLLRLGDEIDDYCPRCKLLLNHAVASLVASTVVKVVCQTCHSEHPYKNAVIPPKKKSGPRAALMDQVLAKVAPAAADASPAETPSEPGEAAEPVKKKRAAAPARYISRHTTRPPAGSTRKRLYRSLSILCLTCTVSRETSSYSVPRHTIRRVNPAATKFHSMTHGTSGVSCQ